MLKLLSPLLVLVDTLTTIQTRLSLENVMLRQQLAVLQRPARTS